MIRSTTVRIKTMIFNDGKKKKEKKGKDASFLLLPKKKKKKLICPIALMDISSYFFSGNIIIFFLISIFCTFGNNSIFASTTCIFAHIFFGKNCALLLICGPNALIGWLVFGGKVREGESEGESNKRRGDSDKGEGDSSKRKGRAVRRRGRQRRPRRNVSTRLFTRLCIS